MMQGMLHNGIVFTKKAGGAINANRIVTLDASANVVECGAGVVGIGFVVEAWASGDEGVTIYSLANSRVPLIAGGAIAVNDYVKVGAGGKVVAEATPTTRTVATVGKAETAASVDGDMIYVWLEA